MRLGRSQTKAILRRIFETVRDLGGIPHNLLGYTADIDAGAPQPSGFHDGDLGTVFGSTLRGRKPAAAATNDYEIELVRHTTL